MDQFNLKNYPIYANFLNKLAKDLTKFYYKKLDKPFKISNNKVNAAKYLFPDRRTFVAPILPEPIFLTSFPPKELFNIKPNGIDPLKYEKKTTNKISIAN